ncbi:MAG TPA: hypothetical protein PLU30_13330 [Verrucomicrobiae bacterium]|nr:hypothetical protein [Verrucomicrobiae bacterium]
MADILPVPWRGANPFGGCSACGQMAERMGRGNHGALLLRTYNRGGLGHENPTK